MITFRYAVDHPSASSPKFLFGPASRIDENHWQSGAPLDLHRLPDAGFHAVILCAMPVDYREQGVCIPESVSGLEILKVPMIDDEADFITIRSAEKAAAWMAARLAQGHQTLVSCIAGRNRSGLVSALVLMQRRGMSGREAVERVRSRRPNAFLNESFKVYVESL